VVTAVVAVVVVRTVLAAVANVAPVLAAVATVVFVDVDVVVVFEGRISIGGGITMSSIMTAMAAADSCFCIDDLTADDI